MDFDATTFRVFLHVLGASVWVGGQIVLGALVPTLRELGCRFAPPHAIGTFVLDALTAEEHTAKHTEPAGLKQWRRPPSDESGARAGDARHTPVFRDLLRSRVVTQIRDANGWPVSHAVRLLPGAPRACCNGC